MHGVCPCAASCCCIGWTFLWTLRTGKPSIDANIWKDHSRIRFPVLLRLKDDAIWQHCDRYCRNHCWRQTNNIDHGCPNRRNPVHNAWQRRRRASKQVRNGWHQEHVSSRLRYEPVLLSVFFFPLIFFLKTKLPLFSSHGRFCCRV